MKLLRSLFWLTIIIGGIDMAYRALAVPFLWAKTPTLQPTWLWFTALVGLMIVGLLATFIGTLQLAREWDHR